nr:hemicentin-1 [Helicoverpa armigera]
MGGRIFPLVFLVAVSSISKVLCNGNGSLTFVIDDTGSMYNDIDQVRASVNQIMDTVFNEKSSLIDNMVLVTFNDPDAEVRVNTRNRYRYKTILDEVEAHNIENPDCWEPAMNGVLLGLNESNRDSYMYVFTDAPARDYKDAPRVIELCQRKRIQIVFVLTGNCRRYHIYLAEASNVFFEIAKACSGLAFEIDKSQVSEVLGPIKELIKGNKSIFVSTTIEANVYKNIPFRIDTHTDYAIISVSGKEPYLEVKGPAVQLEDLMRNDNGIVVKLNNIRPGEYVATVGSKSRTSIIIVGRTDFFFTPGFSESMPKSAKDVTPQPIADTKVHLSASVIDEHNSVQIVTAEIVQMNDKVIQTLPLIKVSKDFYVTQPFVAPSQMFRVVVNGIVKATGLPIKRIAKLPVTSIPQPKRRPTAVITQGTSLQYDYNDEVKLTCKVEAHPEPKIKWVNSKGSRIQSTTSRTDVPYEYISDIKTQVSKSDKFICYAENNEGKSSASATVTVRDPFVVKEVPSGVAKLAYGAEGIITCDVTSKFPMEIQWYHRNDITGMSNKIQTSDKFWVSASQTQIKIRKMSMDLAGQYICKAFLKNQKNMEKEFRTRVFVDGLVRPKLLPIPTTKITKGKNGVLECKALSGVPAPKITWYSGGQTGTKFTLIPGSSNVLRITNAEEKHGGKYKCVAVNDVGRDEHITTVIIQDLPKIIRPNRSTVYMGTEGDATLSIPCVASGLPKPTITWEINNKPLNLGTKYAINDGTLVIRHPTIDDSNSYTCVAKNDVGSVREIFKVFVRQIPEVRGVASVKGIVGKAVNIECRVHKGVPRPKITWKYADDGKNFIPITGSEQVLSISKVEMKHAGRYKCVAQNDVGDAEHITTLVVQEVPKILSSTSTVYKAIEGDELLRIPCVSTGLPKPRIAWKLNGRYITSNAKYSLEDGTLVIRHPTVSDTNRYTCEATNDAGPASATFEAYIRQKPQLSGVATETVRVGHSAVIECKIIKGEPKPKISWYIAQGASEFKKAEAHHERLQIISAEDRHSGRYKCVAENDVGNAEHVTTLVVESAPKFTSKSKTVTAIEGDIALRIPCDVVGVPRPVITWLHKGDKITPNSKYAVEDGNLVIKNPTKTDKGSYTCEAKNYIGSVSGTFEVNVDEGLVDFGTKHDVYLLLGETKKLECGAYKSKSQSIKWFKEFDELKEKFVQINKATYANDGNYTCHVSDEHGHVETHTYVVDVGSIPKLYTPNNLDDWRGDIRDILSNCEVSEAKPEAKITWYFNGKELTDKEVPEIGIRYNWGRYTCTATNVHGSVKKSFDVKSSVCLIPRNLRDAANMPLLLTNEGTWPKWEFTDKYTILEQNEKITLSCPKQEGTSNTFRNFAGQSQLKAVCLSEDTFLLNEKKYKLSDLQCKNSIQLSVLREPVKCSILAEKPELIRVGYNATDFLKIYDVCYDHAKNMPLIARASMTKTDDSVGTNSNWFSYPGIGDTKIARGFTCKDSKTSCCYGKSQLLNAKDFNYETAKKSTFIDYLNGIPIWRPCGSQTSWEKVDDMIRRQLEGEDEMKTWSGTHTFEKKNGAIIPRYLWKVIAYESEDPLAIVHVNSGEPTEKDIKCKNICNDDDQPWFSVKDDYTYCCSLTDFLDAFDLHGMKIGESSA